MEVCCAGVLLSKGVYEQYGYRYLRIQISINATIASGGAKNKALTSLLDRNIILGVEITIPSLYGEIPHIGIYLVRHFN